MSYYKIYSLLSGHQASLHHHCSVSVCRREEMEGERQLHVDTAETETEAWAFKASCWSVFVKKKKWRRKEGKLKKGGRNKERKRNAKIDLKTVGNKRRKKWKEWGSQRLRIKKTTTKMVEDWREGWDVNDENKERRRRGRMDIKEERRVEKRKQGETSWWEVIKGWWKKRFKNRAERRRGGDEDKDVKKKSRLEKKTVRN